jgi:phosphoglycolate phosphatase-like HAD superfamily hydrolase
MSGGLFTDQLLRETALEIDPEWIERLRWRHAEAYQRYAGGIRRLPGTRKLLGWLTQSAMPWAIATSGRMETAAVNLAALDVDPQQIPVVTRHQVEYVQTCSSLPRRGWTPR